MLLLHGILCRYLAANVSMSTGWRTAREGIPAELQHRPPHFIHHMKDAEMKSKEITSTMVQVRNNGIFAVQSSDSSVWYQVDLGDDDRKPNCECRAFCKTHLPCKHFMAVFEHGDGVSWMSLPSYYRDHPLFTADEECLPSHSQSCLPSVSASTQPDPVPTSTTTNNAVSDHIALAEDELTNTINLSVAATGFREVLTQLNSLSYIVESVTTVECATLLAGATATLQCMHSEISAVCPSTGGLLLEPDRSRSNTIKQLKELPPRRKHGSVEHKRKAAEIHPQAKKRSSRKVSHSVTRAESTHFPATADSEVLIDSATENNSVASPTEHQNVMESEELVQNQYEEPPAAETTVPHNARRKLLSRNGNKRNGSISVSCVPPTDNERGVSKTAVYSRNVTPTETLPSPVTVGNQGSSNATDTHSLPTKRRRRLPVTLDIPPRHVTFDANTMPDNEGKSLRGKGMFIPSNCIAHFSTSG